MSTWPRHEWADSPGTRYGIYIVYRENGTTTGWGDPVQWATTSKEGIGTALVQLCEDGDLGLDDRVGVLDGDVGEWIVNPYAAGRSRP